MTQPPHFPNPEEPTPPSAGTPPSHPFLPGPPPPSHAPPPPGAPGSAPPASFRPAAPVSGPAGPPSSAPPSSEEPTVVLGQYGPPGPVPPPAFGPPPPGTGWPPRIEPTPPPKRNRGLAGAVVAIVVLAVAAVTAAVVGVGGPALATFAEPERQYTDTTLRVAVFEQRSLLPGNAYPGSSSMVASALFEGLTTIDPDTGVPLPAVAEGWETVDQQRWTFRLREGLTFHNGEPVTAQSFVDAWSFAADPRNEQESAYLFSRFDIGSDGRLDGVSAVDEHTLDIELTSPWSSLLAAVAVPAFAPMPKECTVTVDACEFDAIGNGPFRQESTWSPGAALTLLPWNEYREGRPQYGGIEFIFTNEATKVAMMMASEDLDVYLTSDPNTPVGEAAENPTLAAPRLTSLRLPDAKPYDQAAVREAISAAIDAEELATVIGSNMEAATGFVPPQLPGAAPCGGCGFDPETAEKRFKDATWPKKTDLTIGYLRSPVNEGVAEVLCKQLEKALDVDCTTAGEDDISVYLSKAADPDYPMLLSWVSDYPSAESFLTDMYADHLGVDDAEFLAALDSGNAAGEATTWFAAAQERLAALMPSVPLYVTNTQARLSSAVIAETVVVDPAGHGLRWNTLELR